MVKRFGEFFFLIFFFSDAKLHTWNNKLPPSGSASAGTGLQRDRISFGLLPREPCGFHGHVPGNLSDISGVSVIFFSLPICALFGSRVGFCSRSGCSREEEHTPRGFGAQTNQPL